jgi:hypothetical protein
MTKFIMAEHKIETTKFVFGILKHPEWNGLLTVLELIVLDSAGKDTELSKRDHERS